MSGTNPSTARDIAQESWVEVDFDPKPNDKFQLLFDGFKAHEELGHPFLLDLDASSGEVQPDINKIVGTSATIWAVQSADNHPDRFWNGVVTRVVSSGLLDGAYRYHIEIRPSFWLLTRIVDCRIFQNKSAYDIITKIFGDAGFPFTDKRKSSSGDVQLEYCVQYRESSFDFVSRLMEQFGIYYYFTHEQGKHTMVLADDTNSHDKTPASIPFTYDQTEVRTVTDHVWELSTDLLLESGTFTMRDYNFTTPAADLTAKTVKKGDFKYEDQNLEVYEYPGPYVDASGGQKITDVRMQAIAKNRKVINAVSNSRALHAGWRFTLTDHPDKQNNREFLITRADFSMSIAESQGTKDSIESIDTYRVTIAAIPGDTPFRSERRTPRPMIRGPQTAKVVVESGEEITTDRYGRVKVKFHWDRTDTQNEQASCWIRVAQASAGGGWGSLFIPRVGQEVVVEFLEGNPDRPIITGVVYNATENVPYSLPENKTRSTIKTNSSKGGGGFNEIRFEDKAGEEEVFFQAQKDYNKVVLHNETVKIHVDTTTTVETGNRKMTVSQGNDEKTVSTGNRTVTVSTGNDDKKVTAGNRTVTVGSGNDNLTVSSGDHKVDVSGGASSITAAKSITLTVGGNSIKIDTAGITINGIKIAATASATMTLDGGGMLTASGGQIKLN